jgi:hypothetical protein
MAQLNFNDFQKKVKLTETFKNFETFKKNIVINHKNMLRLHDYYQQGCKYGVQYLKQNPNLFRTDVALINEIIENEKENREN